MSRQRLARLTVELAGPWTAAGEGRLLERRGHERLRAAGAGPDHALPFTDRVIVTLVYLRFQLPHAALAVLNGVDRSTVTRAVREVRPLLAARGFAVPGEPFTAHKLAVQRRAQPRPGKVDADPVLRQFVQDRLEKRWSPQQVSRALPGEFPGMVPVMSCTRRSIRLSTALSWAGCPASCQPACCAPAVGGASHTAVPANGARTGLSR